MASMSPDRLAELEEERRFLLRSLRDLDRERDAGDVDEHDYETLRDGYTVRAAAVLREIDEGKAALPARRSRRLGRSFLVTACVLVASVGVGVAVARSSGQRLPGAQISGGGVADSRSELLASARVALNQGDPMQAAELYRAVLEEDPDHPEALAYSGWLSALVADQSADAALRRVGITSGKRQLRKAIETDPTYADPHCFLAIIAENFEDDSTTAKRHGTRCLDLDPPVEMRGMVERFVAGLEE